MGNLTQKILLIAVWIIIAGCSDTGSSKSSSSTDDSSSSDSTSEVSNVAATATSSESDDCISGDGTGSNGVFSLTADGSGGNRIEGDGMEAEGSGYRISGGHIWSLSNDNDIAEKTILGDMDQGGSVEIKVEPQTNPAGETIGDVDRCNTGANYTRLTMTVLIGKYKNGLFYPADEHTFSAVNTNSCSSSVSFSVPNYNLSETEYPDVVVKSVLSDGDCQSYGASCDEDILVANSACWRSKVYIKMPNAQAW